MRRLLVVYICLCFCSLSIAQIDSFNRDTISLIPYNTQNCEDKGAIFFKTKEQFFIEQWECLELDALQVVKIENLDNFQSIVYENNTMLPSNIELTDLKITNCYQKNIVTIQALKLL